MERISDECLHIDADQKYLIGIVTKEQIGKKGGGCDWWEVTWEHTALPPVKFQSAMTIAPAIFEYEHIRKKQQKASHQCASNNGSLPKIPLNILNELSRFEQECEGDPYDSESDEDNDTVVTDCDNDADYSAYMKNVNGMKNGERRGK